MIEEVIIAALWYTLAGYFSVASANKILNKRLGWWGRVFYCQSLLKVLIVSLLHPPSPQTSFPQHGEDLQLPSRSCKCANNANPAGWQCRRLKKVTFKSYFFLNSVEISWWVQGQWGSSEGCGNNWDLLSLPEIIAIIAHNALPQGHL